MQLNEASFKRLGGELAQRFGSLSDDALGKNGRHLRDACPTTLLSISPFCKSWTWRREATAATSTAAGVALGYNTREN